tara:strand:- start:1538 stop:1831 length:294 start_codon:yes stop_codon:yes gene_type:complete
MGDKITNFADVAKQIADLLSKGEHSNLIAVLLKGKGRGHYYSMLHKKPILVPRKGEYFLLPIEEDENGKLYVFSNYIFMSGLILLVSKEDIDIIGEN